MEECKEREKIYACWLCNFPYIGNGQIHRLSELCGGPEGVYLAKPEIWGSILSPQQTARLKEYTANWRPEKSYHEIQAKGIRIVTVKDMDYPDRLREISDAPYCLFVKGKLPDEEAPAVAVIGARECSEYGKYVANLLGRVLGKYKVTVISGMARGIDCISQMAALEAGGSSIGVLGCGVDICYPAQNKALYERLIREGGVISSYPLSTPARPQNFPPRNRIVSGLADVVIVVEARIKSGTLITVDMALEQGREVYVVPGRVTDRLSDGCNRLIRQGAGVLWNLEEFVEELWAIRNRKKGNCHVRMSNSNLCWDSGMKTEKEQYNPYCGGAEMGTAKIIKLSSELTSIYEALDFSPQSAEEIRGKLAGKFEERQIMMLLMELCVEKMAIQISPGRFCRGKG